MATHLWRFDAQFDPHLDGADLGQWREVEIVRTTPRYLFIPRNYRDHPRLTDVGHLCVSRLRLDRHGRVYSPRAGETFYNDKGREVEDARRAEREAAP